MEKINANRIKRDCFIALLFPVALLSLIQSGLIENWSSKSIVFIAISGCIGLTYYIYQFFIRLENLLWQEQLIGVVKKISTPVLIADQDHEIIFINDSFCRISFLSTILKYKKLPELLALQDSDVENQTALLNKISYKVKTKFRIKDQNFEWVLIPIFSPLGKRWGTLVECVSSDHSQELINKAVENFPFANVLDQLPLPVMLIDKNERVLYVNLCLKMLLIRHQGLIHALCPTWDLYDPTGDTLVHFMKLAKVKEESFQSLLQSGSGKITLHEESYLLTVQSIVGNKGNYLGTLVLWQDERSLIDPIFDQRN